MNTIKGIILAGGNGTRLHPMTEVVSKQLLPVYDKPMIYYPLTTLMQIGIRDILIISIPHDISRFESLLGNGSKYGINLNYAVQNSPDGLAEALIIAEQFIDNSPSCLIWGDNLFAGSDFNDKKLLHISTSGATVFAYHVNDPERYGVVEFDDKHKVLHITEKPDFPKSNYAVTGLYFYDENVVNYAKTLFKSARGEYEITDLNNIYLSLNKLKVNIVNKNNIWSDMGTPNSLSDSINYIRNTQKEGVLIGSPEITGFQNGWLSKNEILKQISKYKSDYYLKIRAILNGVN